MARWWRTAAVVNGGSPSSSVAAGPTRSHGPMAPSSRGRPPRRRPSPPARPSRLRSPWLRCPRGSSPSWPARARGDRTGGWTAAGPRRPTPCCRPTAPPTTPTWSSSAPRPGGTARRAAGPTPRRRRTSTRPSCRPDEWAGRGWSRWPSAGVRTWSSGRWGGPPIGTG